MATNKAFKGSLLAFLAAAVAATIMVVLAVAASKPAQAATDVLPDLRMKVQNLRIDTETQVGRKLLRFDSIVVNVGAGRMEARGSRTDTTTDMSVRQRIYNDAGGYRDRSTAAKMYFGGDGHNHWHVRDLEDYVLTRLDNGSRVGTGAKHGFCFFDNYVYRTGSPSYYKGCGSNPDALRQTMGLSSGWGDTYLSSLPDQYIDVTGLTSGNYRLRATADTANWFLETNNTNNFTWVDIRISGDSVSVVRWGPGV